MAVSIVHVVNFHPIQQTAFALTQPANCVTDLALFFYQRITTKTNVEGYLTGKEEPNCIKHSTYLFREIH